MNSLAKVAARMSVTAMIGRLRRSVIYEANSLAATAFRSHAYPRRNESSSASAESCARACSPQPHIAIVFASLRAR